MHEENAKHQRDYRARKKGEFLQLKEKLERELIRNDELQNRVTDLKGELEVSKLVIEDYMKECEHWKHLCTQRSPLLPRAPLFDTLFCGKDR